MLGWELGPPDEVTLEKAVPMRPPREQASTMYLGSEG